MRAQLGIICVEPECSGSGSTQMSVPTPPPPPPLGPDKHLCPAPVCSHLARQPNVVACVVPMENHAQGKATLDPGCCC